MNACPVCGDDPCQFCKIKLGKVKFALEKSVELQTFYAARLNALDNGQRILFPNADAWLARLEEIK